MAPRKYIHIEVSLGSRVEYHHRAAVARYRTSHNFRRWVLTEGARKNYYSLETFEHEPDMFNDWPEQTRPRGFGTINKTVMVWPEEGSGIVIGRVKRQKGISHASSGGYEDFESGYFDPMESFTLYLVRHELDEKEPIMVPEWAIKIWRADD